MLVAREELRAILAGEHKDPFHVLGCHEVEGGVAVRVFAPEAREVQVVDPADASKAHSMERVHQDGFFEVVLPGKKHFIPRLRLGNWEGHRWELIDPYSFPPVLGDLDLYYHSEGTYLQAYEKFGAHVLTHAGVPGVSFAVWAPTARSVSVIGEFNRWDPRRHPMRMRGGSGTWELFVPGLVPGTLYKYDVRAADGTTLEKSDPYAFCAEPRPRTASVVYDLSQYKWSDQEWLKRRAEFKPLESAMSIYELHAGSWARVPEEGDRPLSYRELAERLVPYLKREGFTHVELLPVAEHPFGGSWGYQVTSFYAPTRRYGWPEEFAWFVNHLHENGLGIILDWVPAHFPRDAHSLARFDGTCCYEHADPRQGEHKDWGTLIFNCGRNEVRSFLLSNAKFWLETYHIDGLRVDAVASMLYLDYSRQPNEWVPNKYGGKENLDAISLLRNLNDFVHREHPGAVTIAEESTAWPGVSRPVYTGGLGFTLKWNMGWMHDTLAYFKQDPLFRRWTHDKLTFSLLYAFNENFALVLSHDEVVHLKASLINKMPGDPWQRFANLRSMFAYMWSHPGKKLLFMGGEIAQGSEWSHQRSLDWHLLEDPQHQGVNQLVADLNKAYTSEKALHEVDHSWPGFEWVDFRDADNNIISYLRKAKDDDDCILVVCNFAPVPRPAYRVGCPRMGFWKEILNTDAAVYGGSNVGNAGGRYAEETPWHGQACSVSLDLPPLGVIYLKPEPVSEEVKRAKAEARAKSEADARAQAQAEHREHVEREAAEAVAEKAARIAAVKAASAPAPAPDPAPAPETKPSGERKPGGRKKG